MDKFCLVAMMLFAMQRNYDESFGVYNKYFDNKQFRERVLPL